MQDRFQEELFAVQDGRDTMIKGIFFANDFNVSRTLDREIPSAIFGTSKTI